MTKGWEPPQPQLLIELEMLDWSFVDPSKFTRTHDEKFVKV